MLYDTQNCCCLERRLVPCSIAGIFVFSCLVILEGKLERLFFQKVVVRCGVVAESARMPRSPLLGKRMVSTAERVEEEDTLLCEP